MSAGATVIELLQALKPLVRAHGDLQVCVRHPTLGVEGLTFVELRSERSEWIDLYSGTVGDVYTVQRLANELHRMAFRGASDYELFIFHPAHGAEPLTEITAAADYVLFLTECSDVRRSARKCKSGV